MVRIIKLVHDQELCQIEISCWVDEYKPSISFGTRVECDCGSVFEYTNDGWTKVAKTKFDWET